MLSDLWIILKFSIHTAIRNICNVLVASATDAMCPWGRPGKIRLLDFSVKALGILSVIVSPTRSGDTMDSSSLSSASAEISC